MIDKIKKAIAERAKKFKKANKEYIKARNHTDAIIKVTRPGKKKPIINGKVR